MKIRRVIAIAAITMLSVPLVLYALIVASGHSLLDRFVRERIAWKTAAIPRLNKLSHSDQEIAAELELLKANRREGKFPEWTGKNVLLMANDEFLIYDFWHGWNSGTLHHLFLARGSDGRWLYSTFHFCNSMASVIGDTAPASIAEFADRYSAREFDGESDECLKPTWSPPRDPSDAEPSDAAASP